MTSEKKEIVFELPTIVFSRSKLIGDFVTDKVSLSVSAESSEKSLSQFKRVLKSLDDNEEDKKRLGGEKHGKIR